MAKATTTPDDDKSKSTTTRRRSSAPPPPKPPAELAAEAGDANDANDDISEMSAGEIGERAIAEHKAIAESDRSKVEQYWRMGAYIRRLDTLILSAPIPPDHPYLAHGESKTAWMTAEGIDATYASRAKLISGRLSLDELAEMSLNKALAEAQRRKRDAEQAAKANKPPKVLTDKEKHALVKRTIKSVHDALDKLTESVGVGDDPLDANFYAADFDAEKIKQLSEMFDLLETLEPFRRIVEGQPDAEPAVE